MRLPFGIRIERKRAGGSAKLRNVDSIQKERPSVTFEQRIAQLKESDTTGISVRVRRDTSPRGYLKKRWKLLDIDLGTFYGEVADEGGGGSYTAEVLLNDIPMTLDGSNRLERYDFDVIGPDKGKEKKEGKKDEKPSISIDGFLKFISDPEKLAGLISGVNILLGRNGKDNQAAMMSSIVDTIAKLREMTPDAGKQIRETLEMVNTVAQAVRPPVSTTGPVAPTGSGFLEQIVRGAAPTIERILTQQMQTQTGRTPAIAGTPTPQLPQTPQTAQGAPQTPQTTQTQGVAPQASAAQLPQVNPLVHIRGMIAQRADPSDIAAYIVDALDTYAKFSTGEIPVEFKALLERPGMAFERLATFIPELAEDPGYRESLKRTVVNLTEQWKQSQGIGGSADVQTEDIPQSEPESAEGAGENPDDGSTD